MEEVEFSKEKVPDKLARIFGDKLLGYYEFAGTIRLRLKAPMTTNEQAQFNATFTEHTGMKRRTVQKIEEFTTGS